MRKYIIRRVLYFFPTLFLIALASFILSLHAPGDEIKARMFQQELGRGVDGVESVEKYRKWRKDRRLDLPLFYFSAGSYAEPDTFHRLSAYFPTPSIHRLIFTYGNWPEIQAYVSHILVFEHQLRQISLPLARTLMGQLKQLQNAHDTQQIEAYLNIIRETILSSDTIQLDSDIRLSITSSFLTLRHLYSQIETRATVWKLYIPYVTFHGFSNQFHLWLKDYLAGNWGKSFRDRQQIDVKIRDHLFWTVILSLSAFILSMLISIPVGIWCALHANSKGDRIIGIVLFSLDAIPNFWMASILLGLFANPDVFNWFPASFQSRLLSSNDENLFIIFFQHLPNLVLPLIAYTYGSLALISRTMRSSMLEVLSKDYIRTAKAKGLKQYLVIYKHALGNAILPIITFSASIFPALVGGSVILESIFSIPGLGRVTLEAIQDQDHYLIVALFTLTGLMTVMGYLITDILYAWVNPNIRKNSFSS